MPDAIDSVAGGLAQGHRWLTLTDAMAVLLGGGLEVSANHAPALSRDLNMVCGGLLVVIGAFDLIRRIIKGVREPG